MFDEFRPSSTRKEARRRLGGSVAIATVLYGSLAVLIISGTRAATRVVEEDLVQVKFATPPPPAPKPEPPPQAAAQPAASTPRPKAKRRALKPPDEVPEDKPKESDAPLAESDEAGPVDGFTDGVEGGTGTASAPPPPPAPPKPEPLVAPVPLKGNAAPAYSASARRKEVEGVVVVSFEVLENGSVANVQIVSGPEELRENVLKTVSTWRFQPARRGGKPVRLRQTKSIHFRLSSA